MSYFAPVPRLRKVTGFLSHVNVRSIVVDYKQYPATQEITLELRKLNTKYQLRVRLYLNDDFVERVEIIEKKAKH